MPPDESEIDFLQAKRLVTDVESRVGCERLVDDGGKYGAGIGIRPCAEAVGIHEADFERKPDEVTADPFAE